MTFMAYIDETGDTGEPSLRGSTSYFGLGCVILDLDRWPQTMDALNAYRRRLQGSLGIPVSQELKANFLIRNNGGLRPLGLSPSQRAYVYRGHLKLLAPLGMEAFAVVTDKEKSGFVGSKCLEETWLMLLQRLERMTTYEDRSVMITHDNGDNDSVRALVRRARHRLTAGGRFGDTFQMAATRIIEDPVPRDSQNSYLLQLADMVAYAGWRSYMPPGPGAAAVVPADSWTHIGSATRRVVNSVALNGSVPGVVLRTR